MATTAKSLGKKTTARTPTSRAKSRVKRIARKARKSLDAAAHDTELALNRTTRKLKGAAQKVGTQFEQAKKPVKRHARRVERNVVSTLASAGELITGAVRKAKSRLAAATKKVG